MMSEIICGVTSVVPSFTSQLNLDLCDIWNTSKTVRSLMSEIIVVKHHQQTNELRRKLTISLINSNFCRVGKNTWFQDRFRSNCRFFAKFVSEMKLFL